MGDLASIPELGRSPGEVNGNLLPYYNPENSKRGHKELDLVDQLSLSRVEGVSKKNWKKKKDHLSQVTGTLFGRNIAVSGFPDSSVGKESACNAGDSGSLPGSGRSPGEGKGYPLQ